MDRMRCLTADGIDEFGRYLKKLRAQGDLPPPRALLTDDACSVASTLGDVSVEPRDFASRRDFAEYIDNRFLEAGVFVDADEPGMWEWLSLFFFDAVCPPNRDGIRTPGVEGRHLLRDPDARRRHRHLLRSPYLLFRQYAGGADGELDLLLGYALPVHGVAATHIGERHRIMASPGALVAASRLYFDRATQQPRLGYSHNENGLRAYCKFINNLPECFDLSATSADTIIALLPRKFETWMADVVDEEARATRGSLRHLREAIQLNPTVAQLGAVRRPTSERPRPRDYPTASNGPVRRFQNRSHGRIRLKVCDFRVGAAPQCRYGLPSLRGGGGAHYSGGMWRKRPHPERAGVEPHDPLGV